LSHRPRTRKAGLGRGSRLLKLVDRNIGIPAIYFLGLVSRKREKPPLLRRVGILHTAAIGDTVLSSGALKDLRRGLPESEIIFFAGDSNWAIAQLVDGPHKVVRLNLTRLLSSVLTISDFKLDALLDFGPWPRLNALLSRLSRTAYTVGFNTAGQYRHFAYDQTVDHSAEAHELDNYRRLVQVLDVATGSAPSLKDPGPPLSGPSLQRGHYIVFHLWPGGFKNELKRWPLERWVRLAGDLARCGHRVVLTGARDDMVRNAEVVKAVGKAMRSSLINVAGEPIESTLRILRGSRLVVSVDTGVMHIAAALGVPLIALHGPSPSKRWGPVSDRALAIDSRFPGCGYLNLGFEYKPVNPPCMECIPYEVVRDACMKMLKIHAVQVS
jgi:ADP-heptose:LPS heptosyltransferase